METGNIYAEQPATRPSARSPIIRGCSKNHDMDGQNVLYADGAPEFQATDLKSDAFFGTTQPARDFRSCPRKPPLPAVRPATRYS